MGGFGFLLIVSTNLLFLLYMSTISFAVYSIGPSQSIFDGRTLVSKDGSFELGFFSPGSSKNRYLGIWYNYKNIPVQTVVWVANRCNPITDLSGVLMINNTGYLVVLGQNKTVFWSTNSVRHAESARVQLLDSGNLVLTDGKDGNSGTYLWQSFDYPSDTLLPGMKLGWDLRTGLKRRISAWKNAEDPCPGNFTYGIEMDLQAYPQAFVRNSTSKIYRAIPLNGLTFCGASEKHSTRYSLYYMYNPTIKSITSRIVLNQTTSSCARFHWKKESQAWTVHSSRPRDLCDRYSFCGANSNCILGQSPVCQCLKGFKPKSQEKWNLTDWSLGCVRNEPLSCQGRDKDGFVKFVGLKLPDTTHSWVDKTINLKECRAKCLKNCSCTAYRSSDIGGRTGCTIWFGDLIDIAQVSAGGQEIFIRMPASELVPFASIKVKELTLLFMAEEKNDGKVKTAVIVAVVVVVVFSGLLLVGCYIRRSRKKFEGKLTYPHHLSNIEFKFLTTMSISTTCEKTEIRQRDQDNEGARNGELELPLFELTTLVSATDNFSSNNKLGEGGFGPVYKEFYHPTSPNLIGHASIKCNISSSSIVDKAYN
ncbi:unnamed protein product [Malus baccata var. baccata]